MTGKQKTWAASPKKPEKRGVPEQIKTEVSRAAEKLISDQLKPRHVKPAPEDPEFNYLVDIFTKWYRNYFYFCSKYACPGPHAISPFFDEMFARMEFAGDNRFHLSYKRHTGQWLEIHQNLSLDECLKKIDEDPDFWP